MSIEIQKRKHSPSLPYAVRLGRYVAFGPTVKAALAALATKVITGNPLA